MNKPDLHVVTGAFGYSGKYIARRLLGMDKKVRTLTNSPGRVNEFAGRIEVFPYNFGSPERLADSLKGAAVLYNTYWVRFNHADFRHSLAVENTLKLFTAAKKAGVGRIVHTSITNPSENSQLEYFSGKAVLEKELIQSGISYSILRPAVLFGHEDILINNIVWMIRRFPVFCMAGDGAYRLQPIYVDDFAGLAVEEGRRRDDRIIDATGAETFTFRSLVETVCLILNKRRPILSVPDGLLYLLGRIVGSFVGDLVLTREEITGLKSGLLYTDSPPAGKTRLSDWLRENSGTVGLHYAGELPRRRDRLKAY